MCILAFFQTYKRIMKRVLFPGSFDPFTKGHESVIQKAIPLFDEIVIGVGVNSSKNYLFDLETRLKHIKSIYKNQPKVRVETFFKLTVEYCKDIDAQYILRGLRDTKDFEYEKAIAQMNLHLSGIETVFFMTDPAVAPINATIVREIAKNGGKIDAFVTNPEILVSSL
jgi:pantetheine-phosphate adenylyltransferase